MSYRGLDILEPSGTGPNRHLARGRQRVGGTQGTSRSVLRGSLSTRGGEEERHARDRESRREDGDVLSFEVETERRMPI